MKQLYERPNVCLQVREEDYFERQSGVSASFGEMLLLIAIHFHSQQLASICDLVCTTLGMKIAIRTSSMSRMKAIFTQEIFNEQVCDLSFSCEMISYSSSVS